MAQDSNPDVTPTSVTTADVANAKNLNLSLSAVRQALGDGSTAVVTALTSIASAVSSSLIGGTTGTTANRVLVSKGTGGHTLQATVATLDPATGDLNLPGTLGLEGSTSGIVTIQPQAAAGTWNFNLPITAGTSGQVLTSAGGGSSPMTWVNPSSGSGSGLVIASTAITNGTDGRLLYQAAVGVLGEISSGTSGYLLQSDGTTPSWAGFLQSGTGAVTRTWQNKARDSFNVKDFGAVGDGSTDDSTAFQNAINAAYAVGGGDIYVPPTSDAYVIGTGLTMSNGVALVGAETKNWYGSESTLAEWADKGSWLKPTDTVNPCITMEGVGNVVKGINFIYAQPVPAGSFTPTTYPYAIKVTQNFVSIQNVMIIAATHGIEFSFTQASGGGSYTFLKDIFLSCFVRGIHFKRVNDTMFAEDIHHRNLWYVTDADVIAYIEANCIDWDVEYLDNLQATGIEFFQSKTAIKFTDATVDFGAGTLTHAASYLQLSNVLFNLVVQAVDVAATDTTITAQFNGVVAQSDTTTSAAASFMFNFASDNVDVEMSRVWAPVVGKGFLKLGNGTGGKVRIDGLNIGQYSDFAAGHVCFNLGAGATLDLPSGVQNITPDGAAGAIFAGSGTVKSVTYPNATPIKWLNSSGVAQQVMTLHSDNNLYIDTASNIVSRAAGSNGTTLTSAAFSPTTTDALALGTSSLMWSDLFLASGAVINWNSDVLLTHSADALAFTGAASGYTFDTGISLGTGATQPFTVAPTGNTISTKSSLTVQGSRQSATVRTFQVNVGLTSAVGFGAAGAGNADGVAIYAGVDGQTNSGDIWAINTVTNLAANLNNAINAYGYELDFDNVYADYTSLSPVAAGLAISGAGTKLSSAAMLITGTVSGLGLAPIWTMGIAMTGISIRDYSILDQTNSLYAHLIQGTHSVGLDLSGATISAYGINLGTGHILTWGSGDITLTGSSNLLAFAGAASGYTFDGLNIVGHTASLSVGGNADNSQVWGTTAATGGMALGMFNATAGTAAHFDFYRSKNASIGSATVVASGDGLGSLNWFGAQQTGTFATQTMAAQIRAEVDGTVTSGAGGDMPGRIVFATTADAGSAVTDRLILDSAGILKPNANDGVALGTATLSYADLFLASGAVINFNSGNVTLTHSANILSIAASSGVNFNGPAYPVANDGAALGGSGNQWSDLFLAEGGVINWDNGDVTLTQVGNLLTGAGALDYVFSDDQDASTVRVRVHNVGDGNVVTKLSAFSHYGNDTVNSVKELLRYEAVPEDSNCTASTANFYTRTSDTVTKRLSITSTGFATLVGAFSRGAPVTKTGDFTLADTENNIIINKSSSCSVTFPAASSWPGREVLMKSITANGATSASSNVVPNTTATAGTALLPTTDGAWVLLVSDASNWIIMSSSTLV